MEWALPMLIVLAAFSFGFFVSHHIWKIKAHGAEKNAEAILRDAKKEAKTLLKDAELQAKEILISQREAFEEEVKLRRKELAVTEERVTLRDATLDRKLTLLDKKEDTLETKLNLIQRERETINLREGEIDLILLEQTNKLETITDLSVEKAREELFDWIKSDIEDETGTFIRQSQENAKEKAKQEAQRITTLAIQRYAAENVADTTTTSIALPNDEMKGRIIGKEGRNIRALEAITGVDVLIDDTPGMVILSTFDPLRREIASIALQRLIEDGRIHPARIEDVTAKVREELEQTMKQAGEKALLELGLRNLAPEIIQTLGRLKYRNSFSQNVLTHSIEMAHLMGMMASELGLDATLAKRIGLLHDIGKAITQEKEGSHATIGASLLRKNGEDPVLVNAVAAHHGDEEQQSLYATLTVAADAMTAARPGARTDSSDLYFKRLTDLEKIATSFRGVLNCYAIHAGREIRVMVEPQKINDDQAMQLARNIAQQIEEKMDYPGQIKITIVRETRCVEYAR